MRIAIQGIAGSFHDWAVRKFFGENHSVVACRYFSDLPVCLKEGKADKAVMAIENSLAGSILPNYLLLDENNLQIEGEIYLPVQHSLMTLPGTKLMQINEVLSHSMALHQCKLFFKAHSHLKRVEFEDTAGAAKYISEKKLKNTAAIAPAIAARLYGLEIIAENIQDHPTNTTRFVVLRTPSEPEFDGNDKISLKVNLDHRSGSLYDFLGIIAHAGLNMTKIQSVPIGDKPFEYAFFIDMAYEYPDQISKALKQMKEHANRVKILGVYKNGQL